MCNDENAKKLVQEFLEILDTQESSDSGRMFHPVYISSCRVMKTVRLAEILKDLREWTELDKPAPEVYNTSTIILD